MNILHFTNLEIQVKTISSEEVAYLKTYLLNSSKFQKFELSFRESTIDEYLYMLIGEPHRNFSDVKKVWYFRIANTDDYMHIVLNTPEHTRNAKLKSITFKRVAKEDTPFLINRDRVN
ncbi:Protein CBG17321 [Caenorhabditis briggsae]|uniref:Protein CBG17321 n=1 Tax=Caenorhabditis briggsae TaxID=6238 RepID=A8XQU1_CAEBR|nr:Protein CBG17321 [Caenorhabditis briggsae]CAP35016.1 Protein CBG17321 [Caenorhabditis briggsae]